MMRTPISEVLPLRRRPEQREADAEDADDERAEQRAEDRAAAAEERDAADHHGGDGVDIGELARRAGETEPMRPISTQPAMRADEAGKRIDRDQHALDVDAGRAAPHPDRRRSHRRCAAPGGVVEDVPEAPGRAAP